MVYAVNCYLCYLKLQNKQTKNIHSFSAYYKFTGLCPQKYIVTVLLPKAVCMGQNTLCAFCRLDLINLQYTSKQDTNIYTFVLNMVKQFKNCLWERQVMEAFPQNLTCPCCEMILFPSVKGFQCGHLTEKI